MNEIKNSFDSDKSLYETVYLNPFHSIVSLMLTPHLKPLVDQDFLLS